MVNVYLTSAQQKKMLKNQTFQVSAENIHKQPNTEIHLEKKKETIFNRNKRNGKGYRFSEYNISGNGIRGYGFQDESEDDYDSPDEIEGGRFSLKRWQQKQVKTVKKGTNKLANKAYFKAGDRLANLGQSVTGLDVRDKKGSIKKVKAKGKQLANIALKAGINGLAGGVATALSENPIVGIATAKLADKYISNPLNKKVNKAIDGAGLKKKLIKGSQEAKDFMASIRAKRGTSKKAPVVKQVQKTLKLSEINGGTIKPGRKIKGSLPGQGSEYILPRTGSEFRGYGITGYTTSGSGFMV